MDAVFNETVNIVEIDDRCISSGALMLYWTGVVGVSDFLRQAII